MAHVAWTLTDNSTGSPVVYSFPINPKEFEPPGRTANIGAEVALAPNGQPVVFQGRDKIGQGNMTGIINSQTMYDDLKEWTAKWYPMTLTDDQATAWNILITDFKWNRLRKATNQWRYDYTITFLEVG